METITRYRKVYIESLGGHVKVRIFSPVEMEVLDSLPEKERDGELMLQGLHDTSEVMDLLHRRFSRELVTVLFSGENDAFMEKIGRIKFDILEAIGRVNELSALRFNGDEALKTKDAACLIRLDASGKLRISEIVREEI